MESIKTDGRVRPCTHLEVRTGTDLDLHDRSRVRAPSTIRKGPYGDSIEAPPRKHAAMLVKPTVASGRLELGGGKVQVGIGVI